MTGDELIARLTFFWREHKVAKPGKPVYFRDSDGNSYTLVGLRSLANGSTFINIEKKGK